MVDWKALADKWNELSPDLKKQLIDAMRAKRDENPDKFNEWLKEDAGRQIIWVNYAAPPMIPTVKPVMPIVTAKPVPPRVSIGLSKEEMHRLLDVYNNEFFRVLGKVPPNSAATFRVEFEKVKEKTFDEAKEAILVLANDIIAEFRAREKVKGAVPIRPARVSERPEEEKFPVLPGRVPPAQFPSFPLSYDMPFPRGPTSEERDPLWRAFAYRLQQEGYDASEYLDQFEAYIMGTQFLGWEDLREKFNFFMDTIMSGRQLPPLEQWQGVPIPTGLKGLIMEKPELEKIEDLIVHYSSVVIRNKRSKGEIPTLEDLREELVERGIIGADTSLAELRDAAKTAITRAAERQDVWLTGITVTEINDFLASG